MTYAESIIIGTKEKAKRLDVSTFIALASIVTIAGGVAYVFISDKPPTPAVTAPSPPATLPYAISYRVEGSSALATLAASRTNAAALAQHLEQLDGSVEIATGGSSVQLVRSSEVFVTIDTDVVASARVLDAVT